MLSRAREVQRRAGARFGFQMAAGAVIHKGALVVLEAGLLKPGRTATGLVAVGIAEESVRNEGADGATRCAVRHDGLYALAAKPDDAPTGADIGRTCFIHDDETVARTDGGGTRSPAGIIRDVEGATVWIQFA